jgi:Glycogen recognition site of AMP-activated protein kinase
MNAPMIKRTTKLKTNRPTITKAASVKTEASEIEAPKPGPARSEPQNRQSAFPQIEAAKPAPVRDNVPKAHLEFVKPEAKSVCVAGSFNNWSPSKNPLTRSNDGKWVGDLIGISGRHEYLFVVDGQWMPDPNAKESVQNPFGGRNSVLVVSE